MAKILHRDIFWFFMKDKDFVTKTINEGNVDIQKFPASKVWQLAKKMESSKATAKYIQQVAGDLLAAQIQRMQHQHTQLPARNYPRSKQTSTMRRKPQNHKSLEIPTSQKPSDLQKLDCVLWQMHQVVVTHLHAKGFQCPARKLQCKICHKFGHFTTVCYQKSQQLSSSFKTRKPKAQQLCAGALYTHHDADRSGSETSDTEDSFCLQMKIQKNSSYKSTGTQTDILDDQFSLPSTVTSQKKPVSQGMIRHMCRCKSDANGHVLPNVQRPRSEKTHFL